MATSRPPKSSHTTKSAATTLVNTMPTPAAAPDTSAVADENIYQTCLSKLHPIMPVLAGFNHRNRSQHRHARWWAAFGVVRRAAARLVAELEAAHKSSRKKRKRQDGEGGKKKKKKDPVESRAVWIRDHAAPRAYRAFSQLAADNQFAVLGLALLGVLATVRDVCVRLVGEGGVVLPATLPAAPAPETRNVDAGAAAAGRTPTPAAVRGGGGSADLGQVVSREEVAAALALSSSAEAKTKADARRNDINASRVEMDDETVLPPPVKRKKKDPDSSSSREPSSLTPAPKTDGEERKRKKKPDVGAADMDDDKAKKKTKKKKKSKGDEFDALFSSLF
ncbi:RNase MRP subunit [Pestalotiopsis sp. IQ-011]